MSATVLWNFKVMSARKYSIARAQLVCMYYGKYLYTTKPKNTCIAACPVMANGPKTISQTTLRKHLLSISRYSTCCVCVHLYVKPPKWRMFGLLQYRKPIIACLVHIYEFIRKEYWSVKKILSHCVENSLIWKWMVKRLSKETHWIFFSKKIPHVLPYTLLGSHTKLISEKNRA